MKTSDKIKVILSAWGVPVIISIVALVFSIPFYKDIKDFPQATFLPKHVYVHTKYDRKGADSFELRIVSHRDEVFYHRDSEREPIDKLFQRIRRGEELTLRYHRSFQGNVLVNLEHAHGEREVILSFEDIKARKFKRVRFVFIVAGIWFSIGSILVFLVWSALKPIKKGKTRDRAEK